MSKLLEKKTKIDIKKYENAVLFFLAECNNAYLGKTKLNKLLYYLDFISFRDKGRSVTKDSYLHLDYGPVPSDIDDVLVSLNSKGLIAVEDVPFKDGFKTKFISKSKPELKVFSDYEKGLLSDICKKFKSWNTDKIVDQTHLEAPWLYSESYGIVDYNLASDIEVFLDLSDATKA